MLRERSASYIASLTSAPIIQKQCSKRGLVLSSGPRWGGLLHQDAVVFQTYRDVLYVGPALHDAKEQLDEPPIATVKILRAARRAFNSDATRLRYRARDRVRLDALEASKRTFSGNPETLPWYQPRQPTATATDSTDTHAGQEDRVRRRFHTSLRPQVGRRRYRRPLVERTTGT